MNYLSVENLAKSYGPKKLFDGVTFGLEQGDKVALVATNGKGKSTLIKIIAGLETQDSGAVSINNDIRMAYLPQEPEVNDENTLIEEVFSSGNPDVQLVKRYLEVTKTAPESEEMIDLITKMSERDAWSIEAKVQEVLTVLKLEDFEAKVGMLSGGQKKRLGIAKVILEEPDLLMLDEPTNHLDVDIIEWLERFLMNSKMTLLMVTHDRYFLERVCTHIIELTDTGIDKYEGNFSLYLENKALRSEQEQREVAKAKNLYKSELEWMRRQPKARGTKAKSRVDAFEGIKDKAHSLQTEAKLELISTDARQGKKILEIEKASIYFGDKCFLDNFSYIFQKSEKLGIIGPNGVGKTTFLQALMGEQELKSGELVKGLNTKYGYYRQHALELPENERVIDVAKSVGEYVELANGEQISAGRLLEKFLFDGNMQYSKVSTLSGGEKKRLQLLLVLVSNPNFLILDEPTNDLDVQTLQILEEYLITFPGCLLVVSHDRFFLDKVVGRYFVFKGGGEINQFIGTYSDYLDFKRESDIEQKKNAKKEIANSKVKEETKKLSYKEKQELEELDTRIAELNKSIKALENKLSKETNVQELAGLSQQHHHAKEELDLCELRWLELSEI